MTVAPSASIQQVVEESKVPTQQTEEEYEYYEEVSEASQAAADNIAEGDSRVLGDLEALKREELRKLRKLLR